MIKLTIMNSKNNGQKLKQKLQQKFYMQTIISISLFIYYL